MKIFLLLCFIMWIPRIVQAPGYRNLLVLWNVGQGQWATILYQDTCFHIDMGGEKWPQAANKLCQHRSNRVLLSHWDLDHVNFARSAQRKLFDFCFLVLPRYQTNFSQKYLPLCKEALPSFIQEVSSRQLPNHLKKDHTKKSSDRFRSNDLSRVFVFKKDILIPGDSTSGQEKIWANSSSLKTVKLLILGHHGSKTSTSDFLLSRLKQLKMAWVSARWFRYRHPHPQVIHLLRKSKVPLLRTEEWGHLILEI